jgi:hypothetical protein
MSTAKTVYLTWYGWPDNDPPGSAVIAYPRSEGYPTVHEVAGGTGSYADPITLASDPREVAIGTRVYIPELERYFIMEDECVTAEREWHKRRRWHFDCWVGGQGRPAAAVIAREEELTRDQAPVILDPRPGLPVETRPLV